MSGDILHQLTVILEARRSAAQPDKSYVSSLHQKGLNKMLEQVGEECTWTILAAKDAERSAENSRVIHETAALWFHPLVMLSHLGSSAEDVLNELARRFDLSGHD